MNHQVTEGELRMWEKPIKELPSQLTDAQINEKYSAGEQRIVTESNREKIPNFVHALEKPDYMQIRPFYQRRDRWDEIRQSQLIESFIINIPVPPLFVYEKDFNKYEVMDGQQRITALKSFYAGEYRLQGLEIWRELNGKTYSTLPSHVRSGLDRRSVSYIVVLKESTPSDEDAMFLRQIVFARLNTGGVKLEHQEIRNCLFQSEFNKLLVNLTRLDAFRNAFGLPRYTTDEESAGANIRQETLYAKMGDVELVLRFFALRHVEHYTRGMQGFLDIYMARARNFSQRDIDKLGDLYRDTINLAVKLYDDRVFHPFDSEKGDWQQRPQKAFYDAVMVGLSRFLEKREKLLNAKSEIVSATAQLFSDNPPGTFTGRGNSKTDVEERIRKFTEMLGQFT